MLGVVHVDLIVRDMEVSRPFYERLGFSVVEDATVQGAAVEFYSKGAAESMRLVMLEPAGGISGGAMIELMEFTTESGRDFPVAYGAESPSIRNFTMMVDDLDATLDTLAKAGVKPASRIIRMRLPKLGSSRIVFVHDPDGNLIELVDRR